MNFYKYFYRTRKGETCVGIMKTESKKNARFIAAKHLQCSELEVEVEVVTFKEDGFCELYYGG